MQAQSSAAPANHQLAERVLIRLVTAGKWTIDDQGRIWRVKLTSHSRSKLGGLPPWRAERMVGAGYFGVSAVVDGRQTWGLAHRLVWQYFFGDIPTGLTVNHKNGSKTDNRPANLEIVSQSENRMHALRELHAGVAIRMGETSPTARLTNALVSTIRAAH